VIAEQDVKSLLKYLIKERLEGKLLAAAQKIISGESFGAESLEQARLIQLRTAALSAETRQTTAQR